MCPGGCGLVTDLWYCVFDVFSGGGTYPFESNLASWLDGYTCTIALAQLVAHDIHASKAIRRNEAVVQIIRLPSHSRGNRILVSQRSIPTLVFLAISNDFVDVTMGSYKRRKRNSNERLHLVEELASNVKECGEMIVKDCH